jgi:hypothetical protein
MSRDGSRARELLPTVLITLLSIVQAIVLEALWSTVQESSHLFEPGLPAWIGWLQVSAVFQGIVVIWLVYIGMVMRFSWVPTTRDSVAPFVLGALELAMLQMIAPGSVALWFYVLAVIFALSSWLSTSMFQAGLRDAGNEAVARDYAGRLVLREYLVPGFFVVVIAGLGGLVQLLGEGGAALVCVAVANALLIAQGFVIQHYWREWVSGA